MFIVMNDEVHNECYVRLKVKITRTLFNEQILRECFLTLYRIKLMATLNSTVVLVRRIAVTEL